MIKLFAILPVAFLVGCSTCPEQNILIDQNYVLRKAPEELFAIPEYPTVDIINATQADVADWVTRNEERSRELENKILRLKEFFEKPQVTETPVAPPIGN